MYSLLYVDDEPGLLEIGRLFLEQSGELSVTTVLSGAAALEKLSRASFDAIVADFQMPGMDGIELLKKVRTLHGSIPYILFTGKGREEIVIEALNNGADFYLQKGGDPQAQFAELANKIRYAVARRHAEQELKKKNDELNASYSQIAANEEELRQQLDELTAKQDALKNSEEKFRAFTENIPDLTTIVDMTGAYTYISPSILRLTGLNVEDVRGKKFKDLTGIFGLLPGDREILVQTGQLAMKDPGTSIPVPPVCIHDHTGAARYIEGTNTCLPGITGIRGILFHGRDITERKRAEDAVKESEAKYRLVVENSHDAIYIHRDNRLIFANERSADLTGYTTDELLTMNLWDLIHPDDRAVLESSVKKRLSGEDVPSHFMARIITKTRQIREGEFFVDRVRFQGSQAILGIFRDVSDQRNAERALLESEKKYRDLTELLPQIVFEMDLDLNITYGNRHALLAFGCTDDDLRHGINALSYIDPSQHARVKENIKKQLAGFAFETQEYTAIRTDGSTFPAYIYSAPIYRDGKLAGFRGVIVDLSMQKQMHEDLRESEKKFRTLVEFSLDGILITDVTGKILFANPAAAHLLDMADAGALFSENHNLLEFVSGGSQEKITEAMQKALREIESCSGHYKLVTQNKKEIWVECIGNVIPYGGSQALLVSLRDITDRKQTVDMLRDSEKKFTSLFKNSPVALTLVSVTDGKFADVNDAFVRNTGYAREEIIGRTTNEIGIFADPAEHEKITQALRHQQNVYGREYACRIKSGEIRTCRFSSSILMMDDRPFVLSTIEDVTDRRRTEDAVKESRERYRLILMNASDAILVNELTADGPGTFIEVNDKACRLLGMTREDLAALSLVDLDTPEMKLRAPVIMQELKKNHHAVFQTRYLPQKGGKEKILDISATCFGIAGHPTLLSIVRDITEITAQEKERSRIEHVLRESEEKFRTLVETSPDMIWETDAQGIFRYISPRVTDVMGYQPEEIIGKSILNLVTGSGARFAMQELERLVTSDGPCTPFEIPSRHRNGHARTIEIRPSRVTGPYGTLIGFQGVAIDVTDRRQSEEALRLANQQLSLLYGITRHDILNKISVILGYLKLTEGKYGDPALVQYLEKIKTATAAIRSQIEFTRIYQDLGSHEPQWILLETVIPRSQVPDSVTLTVDVQGARVFASPMFEKVFANLLDNSLRHGGHVTAIRVSYHRDEDDGVIVWEDNGIGIPSDEKERIFERGFGKNTGLGMFLAREILSLTGSTIRETGVPGSGARFEIVIPGSGFEGT